MSLAEKINSLPNSPGIYQFKNFSNKIIYIGKAKNLRTRVRSYFQKNKPQDAKTKAMLDKIADVDVILVDSEAEALILEDTLIKQHKPRYNVMLRDDKSYPYVRITNEDFPRIFPTRKIVRDGSKYYGPFTEVRYLKQVLKLLRSIFMFRSCDLKLTEESIAKKKFKICLDYHIGKCNGPCEGLINRDEYLTNIRLAIQVLNGKTKDVERMLEEKMYRLSEELKFEEANLIKQKLNLLREFDAKQKIVTSDLIDRDVFGLAKDGETACSLIFKIRDGKLIGKRHYIITDSRSVSDETIMQLTLEKWYLENDFIPKEIYLSCEPEQFDYIIDWLEKRSKGKVHIFIPKSGEKKKLIDMTNTNALFIAKEYNIAQFNKEKVIPHQVLSLQRDLRLKKPPIRIECFDNSHIQGSELVSSMIVFINGKAKKSEYRKYKIETVNRNDDFAAMREVVFRRYKRQIDEKKELPDLIVIDGGKGQLSAALNVLIELKISDKVEIIGLAKRLEEVFKPDYPETIILPKTSSSLRLLQQIRDEAHRFAITYHRHLREKRTIQTELTAIKGIGLKTAMRLLNEFGSVEIIKTLSKERIAENFGNAIAEKIFNFYHQEQLK